MKKSGNFVDIFSKQIYPAVITVEGGTITDIRRSDGRFENYIIPGFIDAHVHIESSMLVPSEFARQAVKHGTIAAVSDPHEIANVMGMEGVDFMIQNGKEVPLRFYFGAPSSVPATRFESAGAVLGLKEVEDLLKREDIFYLSEMMNYPGVINGDSETIEKIELAKRYNKPVDGHAPGIIGDRLSVYAGAGITTDHEAFTMGEAQEKIARGMKILIREGSAARNLDALAPLYNTDAGKLMLCSDDIHPEMLQKRHINGLVRELVSRKYNLFDVLRSSSVNPVEHYRLDAGLLRVGDYADFVVVKDLEKFEVMETWIGGSIVYDGTDTLFNPEPARRLNRFNASAIAAEEIEVKNQHKSVRVIMVEDGELYTTSMISKWSREETLTSSVQDDILKLVVKDRYRDLPPSVGFIKGIGLKSGAFASSVAHDSHNIIAAGVDDRSIADAVNAVIGSSGGLAISQNGIVDVLPLPVAGIMSDVPCGTIATQYQKLTDSVINMGCHLKAPFMTLSFMALLVIPELKLGDKGLFDGIKFEFTSLFVD